MGVKEAKASLSHVSLKSYLDHVVATNALVGDPLEFALIGVFGEVGSLMEAAKKKEREGPAYHCFQKDAREEFGDTLWYLFLICRTLSVDPEPLFEGSVQNGGYLSSIVSMDQVGAPVAVMPTRMAGPSFLESIFVLGEAASNLFALRVDRSIARQALANFVAAYLDALQASHLSLGEVIHENIAKSGSRFLRGDIKDLPAFDSDFHPDEQLPETFEIEVARRPDGLAVLKWNGVFIGDPLSDNIVVEDGYRFHDVFHLANAAILGWSPVFRALIKHKRKSNRAVDEAQDGGRAIVIEEGLTAWVFARSKDLNFFEDTKRLPYDMLKIIQQFIEGYEVSACPLWLWEDAILEGYKVFREVRAREGGIVLGNRATRSLTYAPTRE